MKTINTDIDTASFQLFCAIEGGHPFWAQEVKHNGAQVVLTAIQSGFYRPKKNGIEEIRQKLRDFDIRQSLESLEEIGAQFLFAGHQCWPSQLNDLANPPFGLVVKGKPERMESLSKSISIVGTRNPSNYGAHIAYDFAAALSASDWAVVSGGAVGIDTAAHQGSINTNGLTFAVLASGFNQLYPKSNTKLFNEIARDGLLISEVMPDAHSVAARFLVRNRLIAALSKATLVVEAAMRSGSIRTARDAAEIFRPVMAIPGPINLPTSVGCHKLISDRCAELVSSVTEIMELVNPLT
jgi:DNA protecting protein DprA